MLKIIWEARAVAGLNCCLRQRLSLSLAAPKDRGWGHRVAVVGLLPAPDGTCGYAMVTGTGLKAKMLMPLGICQFEV